MDIKVGMKAPLFEVISDKNTLVKLEDFIGKRVVLYFYPKDNTPGCSLEAKHFNDNLEKLVANNIVVLGVSKDSVKSHCSFRDKYALKFDLLSDEKSDIIQKYGVWVNKKTFGKEHMGIQRSTFAIDENGIVEMVWENVKAVTHIKEVLDFYNIF